MMQNEELARDFTIAMIPGLYGGDIAYTTESDATDAVNLITRLYKGLCESLKDDNKSDFQIKTFRPKTKT